MAHPRGLRNAKAVAIGAIASLGALQFVHRARIAACIRGSGETAQKSADDIFVAAGWRPSGPRTHADGGG